MVVRNIKFLCGDGFITLHHCRICGEPYHTHDDAEDCEKNHSSNKENSTNKQPQIAYKSTTKKGTLSAIS